MEKLKQGSQSSDTGGARGGGSEVGGLNVNMSTTSNYNDDGTFFYESTTSLLNHGVNNEANQVFDHGTSVSNLQVLKHHSSPLLRTIEEFPTPTYPSK